MPTENQNIAVYPGDGRTVTFDILNQDDSLKPLNLASSDVIWELYREPQHIKIVTKTTVGNGGVKITSASEGLVQVSILGADTQNLKIGGLYKHYLRVVNGAGQPSTVAEGNLTIKN